MRAKNLSKLYYLKKDIECQQSRIKELEALASSSTSRITGLPNSTDISNKVQKYAVQIADLKSELDIKLSKCLNELKNISEYINSIDDPLIRQIMSYRFISCFSWEKTARSIGGNNKAESLRKKLYRYLKVH